MRLIRLRPGSMPGHSLLLGITNEKALFRTRIRKVTQEPRSGGFKESLRLCLSVTSGGCDFRVSENGSKELCRLLRVSV